MLRKKVFVWWNNHQKRSFSLNTTKKIQEKPALLQDNFSRVHNYLRISLTERCNLRFSSGLSHVDDEGRARMVGVSHKISTPRTASASCVVVVGPIVAQQIRLNTTKKGDVLTVCELAGVLAAKSTSNLIPLCHNIPLDKVRVVATLEGDTVRILASAQTTGRTGVEMEALTAASVAALTVYDMCKGIDKSIVIEHLRLLRKTGGQSGDFDYLITPKVREYDTSPSDPSTTVFVGTV